MIRTDLLRGRIAQKGTSQRKVARRLEITERTFYQKMKRGLFSSDEIFRMMEMLEIDDPREIFFAREVSQQAIMGEGGGGQAKGQYGFSGGNNTMRTRGYA